ncbi:helix-turn-helix domain-containing protein [Vibrio sp. 10N.222.51.C12]|uniref:helix-turn-helix domain-containing protein n=1 Tax=unclassified Vibrio TaxID=2614977 RepID=UPI000C854993|nr:helix-turn-helix domain-containing protein [Vibrio sp. 10N.286.48.B7]PMH79764.1 AraC family transcriptional regulator [Vibrio sp. 10N.286.48.B7]
MKKLTARDFFVSSEHSIVTELRAPQEKYPEHSHSFEEIVVVSKGCGVHVINDIPTRLSKNYVCFVNQRDKHLFDDVSNLYLSNILFEREKLRRTPILDRFLVSATQESNDWFIDNEAAVRVESIISSLNIESHKKTPEAVMMCELLFQQLLIELARGKIHDIDLLTDDDRLLSAIVYINKSFDKPINIDLVSSKFKIPTRVFSKGIKKLTGMNFNQYLHFVRAKNATSLLINTDKAITDIAFIVGYSDSNYFSTKFRQATNKTPTDIRKE